MQGQLFYDTYEDAQRQGEVDRMTFPGLWIVTHCNALGWPDERRHLLSGRRQHRIGGAGKWQDGPLPELARGIR